MDESFLLGEGCKSKGATSVEFISLINDCALFWSCNCAVLWNVLLVNVKKFTAISLPWSMPG